MTPPAGRPRGRKRRRIGVEAVSLRCYSVQNLELDFACARGATVVVTVGHLSAVRNDVVYRLLQKVAASRRARCGHKLERFASWGVSMAARSRSA